MFTPSPLKAQSSSRLSSDTEHAFLSRRSPDASPGFRSEEDKEDGPGDEAQAKTTEGERARLERQQTPVWLLVAQHELGSPREPCSYFEGQQTPAKLPTAHKQSTLDASGSFSPLSPHSLELTSTPSWLSAAQQELELGHENAIATMHLDTGTGSLMRGEYSSPHTDAGTTAHTDASEGDVMRRKNATPYTDASVMADIDAVTGEHGCSSSSSGGAVVPNAVAKTEAEVTRAGLSGEPTGSSVVRQRQRWCGAVLVAALLLAAMVGAGRLALWDAEAVAKAEVKLAALAVEALAEATALTARAEAAEADAAEARAQVAEALPRMKAALDKQLAQPYLEPAQLPLRSGERTLRAYSYVWAALLAVLATLRLEFAASTAIALGIVDMVKFPAVRIATPGILALLGPTLKHWCNPLIEFTLAFIGIVVAWYAKATIAAFYAAVRGGRLFAQGFFGLIVDQAAKGIQICPGLVGKDFDPNESVLDEIVGFIIAAQGFMFQLTQGFVLPFPFNVLLLPLSAVEWILRLMSVTSTGVPAV